MGPTRISSSRNSPLGNDDDNEDYDDDSYE